MPPFEVIWARIQRHQTEPFRQVRGGVFTYAVAGNVVMPDRTDRLLARSQFERAFERLPVGGPGELSDLQGPSYLFAILTDPRITG